MRQPAIKEPGTKRAAILAIGVHVLFLGLLIFGVDWKTQEPAAVVVDLWNRLPSPKTAETATPLPPTETAPPPEPKPEPKPEPRPEPKKVEPKPEPKAKPKPELSKADIQLREKQEREKAHKLKEEEDKKKLLAAKEKEAKEKKAVQEKQAAEKKLQDEQNKAAQQQAAAKVKKQSDEYVRRIHDKIRALIVIPPDITGNPQAEFEVVQIPSGEVLELRLTRSSGQKAYDNAVERAISKANPLPQPSDPSMFQRELNLKFRPNE